MTPRKLRNCLAYDPATGLFRWINPPWNHPRMLGQTAGTMVNGYISISIDRKCYRAHQLAWLWMTGKWPSSRLDHRNRKRADNRWSNIRKATATQNAQNHSRLINGSHLPVGVRRQRGTYVARCVGKHLGVFGTVGAASRAYQVRRQELFGEYCPQ